MRASRNNAFPLLYDGNSPTSSAMLVETPIDPAGPQHPGIIRGRDPAHKRGLRAVASIEFLKGVGAVAAAVGLLIIRNKDIWDIADKVLEFFRINTDWHFAQVLLDFADQVTTEEITTVAILAFVYAGVRFVEAYGLWKTTVWGEWLAIFSGLVYLPFEIRALVHGSTPFRWAALVVNIALVAYVAYVRTTELYEIRQEHRRARQRAATGFKPRPGGTAS